MFNIYYKLESKKEFLIQVMVKMENKEKKKGWKKYKKLIFNITGLKLNIESPRLPISDDKVNSQVKKIIKLAKKTYNKKRYSYYREDGCIYVMYFTLYRLCLDFKSNINKNIKDLDSLKSKFNLFKADMKKVINNNQELNVFLFFFNDLSKILLCESQIEFEQYISSQQPNYSEIRFNEFPLDQIVSFFVNLRLRFVGVIGSYYNPINQLKKIIDSM